MGRRIDITEKLNFEEKPIIVIKGKEIEVNDDAATVLKVMLMADDPSPKDLLEMANMIFTEEGKKNLDSLKLNMIDYSTVIENAMTLIVGEDEEGESENNSMT